jgi:hypothetical protein
MGATTIEAVWNAQANNPYYRIRELVLPASTSTRLPPFEFETTFLPHTAGQLVVKSQGQERDMKLVAGQPIEFASGTESQIVNMNEQELRLTVTEYK